MRFKYSFYMIFIILTAIGACKSQNRFMRLYPDSSWAAGLITNVIPTDSGYITAGIFVDTVWFNDGVFINHLDNLGNIIKDTSYIWKDRGYVDMWLPDMIELRPDTFLIFGETGGNFNRSSIIQYYKSSGELIKERIFDELRISGFAHYAQDFFVQSKSKLIMVSSKTGNQGRSDLDTEVFCYDMDLDSVIWTKQIGNSRWRDFGGNLHPIDDEQFLLGFTQLNNHIHQTGFDSRCVIYRMDTAGIILDRYFSDTDQYISEPYHITNAHDGGYVIASSIGTLVRNGEQLSWKPYIFKLNNKLELEWELKIKTNRTGPFARSSRIYKLPNEDSYVSSGVWAIFDSLNTRFAEHLSIILKLDLEGKIKWLREYQFDYDNQDGEDHFNYDMRPTPDGGYIMAGSYSLHGQRGYLIKVDSLGCIVDSCENLITATRQITDNQIADGRRSEIRLYPNPVREILAWQLQTSASLGTKWKGQIINSSGQVVKQMEEVRPDVQYILPVRGWVSGVYVLVIKSSEGDKVSRQFVVE